MDLQIYRSTSALCVGVSLNFRAEGPVSDPFFIFKSMLLKLGGQINRPINLISLYNNNNHNGDDEEDDGDDENGEDDGDGDDEEAVC